MPLPTPPTPDEIIAKATEQVRNIVGAISQDFAPVSGAIDNANVAIQKLGSDFTQGFTNNLNSIKDAINGAITNLNKEGLDALNNLQDLISNLPAIPPVPIILTVNDSPCLTPVDFFLKVMVAINTNQTIKIVVYSPPDITKLIPLTKPIDELRSYLNNVFKTKHMVAELTDGVPVPTPPDAFWILLAVAMVCLAVGASWVMVCIGIAIVLAFVYGYAHIKVKHTTDAQGKDSIEFEVQK
jgi:hypothetical protein